MKISSYEINSWLATRRWRIFWRCVPALLAMALTIVLFALVVSSNQRQSELRLNYRRMVAGLLQTGNYEAARVACLRGLSFDERTRYEWLFYMSIAMNGLGHVQEAAALMNAAAPLDHPGFAQAHLIAAQVLLSSTNNVTEAMAQAAERQLLNALALDPQSTQINEMLGRFYINTHDLEKARQRLLQVYPYKNDVALLLSLTYNAVHDTSSAENWANVAAEVFSKKLKEAHSVDSQSDRLGLAEALLIEKNYAEALKVLEDGLVLSQNQQAYKSGIAEVCVTWAAKLQPDSAEYLHLIQKGLENVPQHLKLHILLVQAAHTSKPARVMLDDYLAKADGESAAWWHFLQATDARQMGNAASARSHLETAYRFGPKIPEIANDLAMHLTTGAQPDLPRALSIIETVLKDNPDNPTFRDTRGQILLKLGRATEAVADLKYAGSKLNHSAETDEALASAYKILIQNQIAAGSLTNAAPVSQ